MTSVWNSPYLDTLVMCPLASLMALQATEPIVDFAIANDKPFAVVPCCVFPRCVTFIWFGIHTDICVIVQEWVCKVLLHWSYVSHTCAFTIIASIHTHPTLTLIGWDSYMQTHFDGWARWTHCGVIVRRLYAERHHRGEPVISHAQFVAYLQAKTTNAKMIRLPFEGQNHVVFSRHQSTLA